jgi:hypothetical protein
VDGHEVTPADEELETKSNDAPTKGERTVNEPRVKVTRRDLPSQLPLVSDKPHWLRCATESRRKGREFDIGARYHRPVERGRLGRPTLRRGDKLAFFGVTQASHRRI